MSYLRAIDLTLLFLLVVSCNEKSPQNKEATEQQKTVEVAVSDEKLNLCYKAL